MSSLPSKHCDKKIKKLTHKIDSLRDKIVFLHYQISLLDSKEPLSASDQILHDKLAHKIEVLEQKQKKYRQLQAVLFDSP